MTHNLIVLWLIWEILSADDQRIAKEGIENKDGCHKDEADFQLESTVSEWLEEISEWDSSKLESNSIWLAHKNEFGVFDSEEAVEWEDGIHGNENAEDWSNFWAGSTQDWKVDLSKDDKDWGKLEGNMLTFKLESLVFEAFIAEFWHEFFIGLWVDVSLNSVKKNWQVLSFNVVGASTLDEFLLEVLREVHDESGIDGEEWEKTINQERNGHDHIRNSLIHIASNSEKHVNT